ncbi:glycosyltransferase [Qipengyuania sp. 1XM1-15A]|uniref:glycosyltransferase family 2 protein n=1 Tax=Qipengyuania xiamenensis TaxID=2867237 RepID=UPI001C87C7C3|nr:glycosyltransferase [Qipengyuania xiamenensis]MBX7531770.1 glycosyltransferase [Qipengyuania xiamenensis]
MISIIIPYYYGHAVVKRALLACVPGLAIDAQVILAFDSPEDEAAREIKEWVRACEGREIPHTTILQNEENIGPAATRRAALPYATGEFVILCDQDDELTSARFERGAIEGADLILFEALRVGDEEERLERHPGIVKRLDRIANPVWNQFLASRRQPARMGAVTMSLDIARSCLSEIDGGGEEWEFFMTAIARRPRVKYDERVGILRHVHGENLSIVKRKERLSNWKARVDRLDLAPLVRKAALRAIGQHEDAGK